MEDEDSDGSDVEEICGISTGEVCRGNCSGSSPLKAEGIRQRQVAQASLSSMRTLRNLFKVRTELSVDQGCIWRQGRILVPMTLQNKVLKEAHRGHPGIVRLKRCCGRGSTGLGMAADAERWVRGCQGCALSDKSGPSRSTEGKDHPCPCGRLGPVGGGHLWTFL